MPRENRCRERIDAKREDRCVENRGVEKRCVENRRVENRCVEKSRVHIFVAGAVFGEVGVSFFVAGAALGEILIDSQSAKCFFPYKMRLQGGTRKVSEAAGAR